MNLRSTSFVAALALLAGCALIYPYGDYRDQGAGGAGTTASGATAATATGSGGVSSTSGSTGGASTTSASTGSTSTTSASTGSGATTGTGGGGLGTACTLNSECASGACEAASVGGRICCMKACGTCHVCDPTGASCVFAAKGAQGVGCAAPHQCDGSGLCVGGLGAACTAPSDCASQLCERALLPATGSVCCASSCSETCQGCGADGLCAEVVSGVPDPTCMNTTMDGMSGATCSPLGKEACICDGTGECKKKMGGACFYPWDCVLAMCTGSNVCP